MANLNQTLIASPIGVLDSTFDSSCYALEHDINLSLSAQNSCQGQTFELVFRRSSGLTVAFKGQRDEEWVHSYVGRASLQVNARQGRETV